MSRRGLTLMELLVSLAIVSIVTAAVMQAYVLAAGYTGRMQAARDDHERHLGFERFLTELLRSAVLTTGDDPDSYFIGGQIDSGSLPGNTPDGLVFTARGARIPPRALRSEDDFETQNSDFGPVGGTAEIGLGIAPVGPAPTTVGLFLREQRPADGDPTQGGFERNLDPRVVECAFEFFDGASWQTQWDTRTGERRLPASVRVTYRLEDEDSPRTLVVRIPPSDVTPENPVGVGGGL